MWLQLIARRNRHYKIIRQIKGHNVGSLQKTSDDEISDDVLANITEDCMMAHPSASDNIKSVAKKIKIQNK